jgi:hypothetical protein
MAEIVCCKYCGNPIDLENSYIHDTCKDWYTFILDSMIEELRLKLIILLNKRLQIK